MGADIEVHLSADHLARTLRADVVKGLSDQPKWLPPRWFYDARGSELFERITELDEYYPTRTEHAILAAHAAEIASLSQARTMIELGSGSSVKTRLLLDACAPTLREFVPLDVSESAVRDALDKLAAEYPDLALRGVVGDFTEHVDRVGGVGPRLVVFLGSTIGNFTASERTALLRAVRSELDTGDRLVLGTDLVKSPSVLVPAYDDADGVTAEFNRNVLRVINTSLGADFDVDAFEHVAVWDAEREWIEMRLRATRPMRVTVSDVDIVVELAAGEEIRTEISAKFRPDGVRAMLQAAGFAVERFFTDADGYFGVSIARAV